MSIYVPKSSIYFPKFRGFPEMGLSLNHPFPDGMVPYFGKPSSDWGVAPGPGKPRGPERHDAMTGGAWSSPSAASSKDRKRAVEGSRGSPKQWADHGNMLDV